MSRETVLAAAFAMITGPAMALPADPKATVIIEAQKKTRLGFRTRATE
jgi:hypothetical protein